MTKDNRVTNYLLVRREGDNVLYWETGVKGLFTEDIAQARRYAQINAARIARIKILKRRPFDPNFFQVETIREPLR